MLYARDDKERKFYHPLGLKDEYSVDCRLKWKDCMPMSQQSFWLQMKGLSAIVDGTDSGGFRQVLWYGRKVLQMNLSKPLMY